MALVDIANLLNAEQLAPVVHEAAGIHRTTARQIEEVIARRPGLPGVRKLRSVLYGDVRVTASWLEQRFLKLLEKHGIPLPETNIAAGGRRVDCRWSTRRLTIELDSYRYHHTRHAWELDRMQEREARRRGDEFRRLTYDDVTLRSEETVREVEALLT